MVENGTTNILPVKHSSYVLQRLNEQRKKGTFCDATLIVEGEKFQVHRSFLAANSDYFLSLFSSAEEQHNFVLAGVPLEGFRVILDFIYTSTFELNLANVHAVHKASSALNFSHVQTACEKVYHKINQMKETTSSNLNVERIQTAACKGVDYKLRMDKSGENKRLRTSPISGSGVGVSQTSSQYLRRISSTRTHSDDSSGSSLSREGDVIPLLSASPCDETSAEHKNNTEPNQLEQLCSMNSKRKIKKEVFITEWFPTEDRSPAKRLKTDKSQTSNVKQVCEHEGTNSRKKQLESQLSVYFEKADYFESSQNVNETETSKNISDRSNLEAKPQKKTSEHLKLFSSTERAKALNRWPSDPQISSKEQFLSKDKNSSVDGDENDKQVYVCSFNAHHMGPETENVNERNLSKDSRVEPVFFKWKLASNKELSPTCSLSENQVKVHRNRRKMFKTNKVCSHTE